MGDVKLPQFVAFKCHNDKYVSYAHTMLDVVEEDILSRHARHEVVPTNNGNIMLKCAYVPGETKTKEYFWYLTTKGLLVRSPYKDSDRDNFLFQPVAVDSISIGLKAVGNNKFCKPCSRTTTKHAKDMSYALLRNPGLIGELNVSSKSRSKKTKEYLKAISDTFEPNARLIVEEPVFKRRILSVNYDLDNAQIYECETIAIGMRKATNNSSYSDDVAVALAQTQTNTCTWKTSRTARVNAQVTVQAGIPHVGDLSITVSEEQITEVEKCGTVEQSTTLNDTFTVKDLPPGGSVVVRLTAMKAKCSVPFTYECKDTLCGGDVVTTQLSDGVFEGVNYSNFEWETT